MGWSEKIDCRASGKAVFECAMSLHLSGIKNVLTGGSQYTFPIRNRLEIFCFIYNGNEESSTNCFKRLIEFFQTRLKYSNQFMTHLQIFYSSNPSFLSSKSNFFSRYSCPMDPADRFKSSFKSLLANCKSLLMIKRSLLISPV